MIRAGAIGWPIAHSLSPILHHFWLAMYGIEGAYEARAIEAANLSSALAHFAQEGWAGVNVTLPYKQAIIDLVQAQEGGHCDAAALACGAANLLLFGSKGWQARNTDGWGFLASLRADWPDYRSADQNVLILGAGGAARAVTQALIADGCTRITLCNRNIARAEEVRAAIDPTIAIQDWAQRQQALAETSLLVNATTLGMAGQPALELDLAGLPSHAVVTDLVYNPLHTPLLQAARAHDLLAIDGLGMLIHQAMPSFQAFYGQNPEVTPTLRAHLLAALEAA